MRPFLKTQKTKFYSAFKPILPLVPVKLPEDDKKSKSKSLTFELKIRAGSPAGAGTYKKQVPMFEEGTPQEWLDTVRDFNEIWQQNTVNGPHDRVATVVAALRGGSNIAFLAALEDARANPAGGAKLALTNELIEVALASVAAIVFPHRALETQRLWMNRIMRKPYDLSTRKTASALSKINNLLPLFPGGTPASKFLEAGVFWSGLFPTNGETCST